MKATKREFVINDLMVEHFIEYEDNVISLEEIEDTGRSRLDFKVVSDKNLVIKNVDKKNTQMQFFEASSKKSMFKRVDHIVFEYLEDDRWKLHLIEMKTGIFDDKWIEIKGKFRASYLLAQGLAAMLEMNIVETCIYTTYEEVHLTPSATMPSGRRLHLGEKLIKPKDEWEGGKFALNFGVRMKFLHVPIQMRRNEEGILTGEWLEETVER